MKTVEVIEEIKYFSLEEGTNMEYECSFKNIRNTNYMAIKNLPKFMVQAEVEITRTKFDSKNIQLTNIVFPKSFVNAYISVLNKYIEEGEDYNGVDDHSFLEDKSFKFGKANSLNISPKLVKCNNINISDGYYKVCISFGSILDYFEFSEETPFKINFHVHSLEKLEERENKIESTIVDDFMY